eukprot:jgi/Undpi1/4055/HiC_scaffold_16.g07422.m1
MADESEVDQRRPSRMKDELTALKVRKLAQQKKLAEEFNVILTRRGGLNDQTRQTCKNLEYAIAIAARPGAIEYYRPPEETKRIVEKRALAVLTRKMTHLQQDIDQVEQDIQQAGALESSAPRPPEPSLSSLSEWFATYGKPAPPPTLGLFTVYEDSPKIYGGTNHHRAFKSQATVMRKGRVTR